MTERLVPATWSTEMKMTTNDAPRPDLDEAERAVRNLLRTHAGLTGEDDAPLMFLAEYDRRGAALADAHAEIARLRHELEPYEILAPQVCPAGEHPEWLIDSERHHACPWCEIARLRDVLDDVRRRVVNLATHIGSVGNYREAIIARIDELRAIETELMRALAAAPAPCQSSATEWADVSHNPAITDTAARAEAEDEDDELGALELVGALFEAADNMLGHLAQAETVAPDDSYVDDLRRARDALAEWHAVPAPAEDECTCSPCTDPAYGAPGFSHCAACCAGTGIAEYDHDCPNADHRDIARRQFPAPALAREQADPAEGEQ